MIRAGIEGSKTCLDRALALGRSETRRPVAAALEMSHAGLALYRVKRPTESREFFEAAVAVQEKLEPSSGLLAVNLFYLANIASDLKDALTEEKYYRRALPLFERFFP